MGNCSCKRTLKTPDQATADQNSPRPMKFIFVDDKCLGQAPDDADTHSVLGTAEEESPDNVVQNKQLQK